MAAVHRVILPAGDPQPICRSRLRTSFRAHDGRTIPATTGTVGPAALAIRQVNLVSMAGAGAPCPNGRDAPASSQTAAGMFPFALPLAGRAIPRALPAAA